MAPECIVGAHRSLSQVIHNATAGQTHSILLTFFRAQSLALLTDTREFWVSPLI